MVVSGGINDNRDGQIGREGLACRKRTWNGCDRDCRRERRCLVGRNTEAMVKWVSINV